ncbi:MAG: hypothetical protein ABJF86_00145 [Tateyamaria sp.]|uniref:MotE family protein n=2 Tax=Tateyamaria sp. TaxID=1929288 RepID=UPI003284F8DD
MKRGRKNKMPSTGRGTNFLIASLLLGSAILRIALSAGTAVAETDFPDQLILPNTLAKSDLAQDVVDQDRITTVLSAVREREKRVEERENQIDIRKKALDVALVEIERRLDALKLAEERLGATLAHAETAAEDDLARLTSVYENMKPKEAAALFEAMEPEFSAGFLARMRPDVAAKIMSGLEPQSAYSISAVLAGRNAQVPKN